MATFDVFNMKREKVGSIDLADEVFGDRGEGAPLLRGREGAARVQAAGHGGREEPLGGQRQHEEALQAEGHRPRASRLDPRARLRRRRPGPPAAPARLELPARRARCALGALTSALSQVRQGGAPRRGRPLRARRDQDQGARRGARRRSRPQKKTLVVDAPTTRTSTSRSATARSTSSCRPRAQRLRPPPARHARPLEGRGQGARAALPRSRRTSRSEPRTPSRSVRNDPRADHPQADRPHREGEPASREAQPGRLRGRAATPTRSRSGTPSRSSSRCTSTSVNTLVMRGKDRRMGRGYAKMQNWKKAIVTLKEGDSIDFFADAERED